MGVKADVLLIDTGQNVPYNIGKGQTGKAEMISEDDSCRKWTLQNHPLFRLAVKYLRVLYYMNLLHN